MITTHQPANRYGQAISILGAQLNPVSVDQVHRYINDVIDHDEKALIMNLNIHCMNLCQKHAWLKEFINSAQMVFCDGDGVRWGARILGLKVPPKIPYGRWIWQLSELAVERDYKLFFLGGRPGVAAEAAEIIHGKFPQLKITAHHGYFKKHGEENDRVVDMINQEKPDVLIVGFGMPIQERWLKENWERVDAHIFLPGGGVFDCVTGRAKCPPSWMLRWNLEWLYRLMREPRRLFGRYVVGNPYFLFRVCQEKLLPGTGTK